MENISSVAITVFSPALKIFLDEIHFYKHLHVHGERITEHGEKCDRELEEASFHQGDYIMNHAWHFATDENAIACLKLFHSRKASSAEQNGSDNSGDISNSCRKMQISETCAERKTVCRKYAKLKVTVDPILASCFVCELKRSVTYRQSVMRNLCRRFVEDELKPGIFYRVKLVIHLTEPELFRLEPDIKW